ncbi:MAG: phosphonopyruvate decarboxylase, partial [Lachnospiraceae bacterium]|nr:phosphonopyruvate decarboxylase [Lachnospiraceae bacterium]
MKVEELVKIIGADFYTGVPDSQLKALCNYLMNTYGIDQKHHIIAANEGNCAALAAGYHLATGRVPVVYMQNSGEGNIINPVASL